MIIMMTKTATVDSELLLMLVVSICVVCVGWFVAVCVLGLICVCRNGYKMVEYHAQHHVIGNCSGYNT